MSTLKVMIGEILVDKKVSKRTMIEIQDSEKLVEIAKEQAKSLSSKAKAELIKDYQEGKFEYGDDVIPDIGGHSALSILKMKNIVLTNKQRSDLVGSLSFDEKRYFGTWLNDNEYLMNAVEEVGGELDGQLSFGNKTYEDGVEVFANNKY
tara:strand:+ start:181 stop:630 length:450 start_codon:yes stop_codon:yes gene_type:complete